MLALWRRLSGGWLNLRLTWLDREPRWASMWDDCDPGLTLCDYGCGRAVPCRHCEAA